MGRKRRREHVLMVEQIVGRKLVLGRAHYLVKWLGYPSWETTWEAGRDLPWSEISRYEVDRANAKFRRFEMESQPIQYPARSLAPKKVRFDIPPPNFQDESTNDNPSISNIKTEVVDPRDPGTLIDKSTRDHNDDLYDLSGRVAEVTEIVGAFRRNDTCCMVVKINSDADNKTFRLVSAEQAQLLIPNLMRKFYCDESEREDKKDFKGKTEWKSNV